MFVRGRFRCNDEGRRAVVDAGGVAGGRGSALTEQAGNFANASTVVPTRGCSSFETTTGVPFFIADAMQGICLIAVLVAMTLSRYQIRFRTSPERRATP